MSRVGIVTGLPFERDIVLRVGRRCGWADAAPLVESAGIGGPEADHIIQKMADSGVSGVISFGLAGALDPDLSSGDLVLADRAVDPAGVEYRVAASWRVRLGIEFGSKERIVSGALFSGPEMISSREEKAALRQRSAAVAADMETAAIAAVSARLGLAFVAIRAISDPAAFSLPSAVMASAGGEKVNLGRLALDVIRRPLQTGDLIRLGRHTRRACAALEKVCQTAGPKFFLET